MSALDRVELVLLVRDEMARREAAGVQAALSAPSTTGVGGPGPSTVTPPARSWSPLGGEGVGSRKHELLLAAPLSTQADGQAQAEGDTDTGLAAGHGENPAPAPKPPALATTKEAAVSKVGDLEVKLAGVRHVRDVSYWKLPEGTPIVPHPDAKALSEAPVGSRFMTGSPDDPGFAWTKTGPDKWMSGKEGDANRRITNTKQLLAYQQGSGNKTALVPPTQYGGAEKGTYTERVNKSLESVTQPPWARSSQRRRERLTQLAPNNSKAARVAQVRAEAKERARKQRNEQRSGVHQNAAGEYVHTATGKRMYPRPGGSGYTSRPR